MSLYQQININELIKVIDSEEEAHPTKEHVHSFAYSSRYSASSLPKYNIPDASIPADAAYQIVHDEMLLDHISTQNMATFVTSWMEKEADQLMIQSLGKNLADQHEYSRSHELQARCVNMIANLWHGQNGNSVGTFATGSSEAFMLAALAMKFNWRNKRKALGLPFDKPNIVFGCNAQVCISKFCVYFDVEARKVPVTQESGYVMDPYAAIPLVDENTIGVVAILGSTFTGKFEDVSLLNSLLDDIQQNYGFDVPIHVDAASGGFVAPFAFPDLVWDFRLPRVVSINVSGHKYGLVYPGAGWIIWREKSMLPREIVFELGMFWKFSETRDTDPRDYLGGEVGTFSINFSRSACHVIGQYYNFIRLGKEGFTTVVTNCLTNAHFLWHCLKKTGLFIQRSRLDEASLPLVAFSLIPSLYVEGVNEYDLSDEVKKYGWVVPAYKLPQSCEKVHLLRVVVRECHSKEFLQALVTDLYRSLNTLRERASNIRTQPTPARVGTLAHNSFSSVC